jgi:hypothetical protein
MVEKSSDDLDLVLRNTYRATLKKGLVSNPNDLIVVTAGLPFGTPGAVNVMYLLALIVGMEFAVLTSTQAQFLAWAYLCTRYSGSNFLVIDCCPILEYADERKRYEGYVGEASRFYKVNRIEKARSQEALMFPSLP